MKTFIFKPGTVIEMERHHCIECVLRADSDLCLLQNFDIDQELDPYPTWEDMMENCPLIEAQTCLEG